MPVSALTPEELAAKKAAKAAYDREYRAKNAEKIRAAKKLWGQSETKRSYDAEYRKSHAEEVKVYKAAWYQENRERVNAEKAAAHRADPEKRLSYARKRYAENRERICAATRAWTAANKDRKKANDAAYYVAKGGEIRARSVAWSAANKERKAESDAAWRKANPVKVKLTQARRRKRVRNATPKWVDTRALDAIYIEALARGLTVDHVIPLKHKKVCGLHVPWNLQHLTRSENSRKSNKFDQEAASCQSTTN